MGQVLDVLQGKEWREKQIRKISDHVFDSLKNDSGSGRANLTFEDLYIAVLLVFNDINKHLPGPHFDPPSKEEVKTLMKECDMNLDGELDREEFVTFVHRLIKDTLNTIVSKKFITTLAVAPTIALMTKRETQDVPVVGKVLQRVPDSVFATLVTLAVVAFQKATSEKR